MRRRLLSCLCILSSLLLNPPEAAAAADWQQIAQGDSGTVSVKTSSIQKQGDGIAVTYRLDFPAPQRNTRGGKDYLSTEIQAVMFCRSRKLTRYELTAYAERESGGEVVGGFKQSLVEAQAQPVAGGGSDEDLWRFLCAGKGPEARK